MAVFYAVGFSLFLSVVSLFVKLAAPGTTNGMTVFARFSVAVFYIFTIIAIKRLHGVKIPFTTSCFGMHVMRAATSCLAQFALFFSLSYIPLVDANLLFMTYSLFIPVLGTIFLSVHTNTKSWLAIVLGFMGVAFVLRPGMEILNFHSLIALSSGLFAALSLLGVHEIAKKDGVYTIMLYYFSLSFILSAFIAIFDWKTPDLHTLLLLLGVGVFGALCQECAIRALAHAPAKIVAPFTYSAIIFSGFFDWLFWGKIPGIFSFIGLVLIATGSVFTVIFTKEKVL